MKDQHTKIKGYRDLSQQEIDLMNRIKEHAENTAELLEEVYNMRTEDTPSGEEWEAMQDESLRCLEIAKTTLQTGQMWFVRAVALPNSF